MAISLDQFTQQLADSGLMSSDEIASVVAGLRASSKPLDGEELARQLVRQGTAGPTAHGSGEPCYRGCRGVSYTA